MHQQPASPDAHALTAGAHDRCTPVSQAREFYQALIGHGVDSELVIYPGEGHGVSRFPAVTDYLTRVLTRFGTYVLAWRLESFDQVTPTCLPANGIQM